MTWNVLQVPEVRVRCHDCPYSSLALEIGDVSELDISREQEIRTAPVIGFGEHRPKMFPSDI